MTSSAFFRASTGVYVISFFALHSDYFVYCSYFFAVLVHCFHYHVLHIALMLIALHLRLQVLGAAAHRCRLGFSRVSGSAGTYPSNLRLSIGSFFLFSCSFGGSRENVDRDIPGDFVATM